MPTVGDLQIKIGADVTSAINGLSKAESATNNVSKAFENAIQSQNNFNKTIYNLESTIRDVANYEIKFFDATKETAEANRLKPIIEELKNKLEENKSSNGGFFSKGFEFDLTLLSDIKTAFNEIKSINPEFAGLDSLNKYIIDFEKNLDQGLKTAIVTPDKILEAFEQANSGIISSGFAVAGWAQNFSTAISAVKRDLESIDLSKVDDEQKESTKSMIALAQGTLRVTESVSTAAAAFSGMTQIAGPALAGLARLIPSISTSLLGLAGPIGIAAGALAAGAALIVSNWDLVAGAISESEKITIAANKATTEQKAKVVELVDVLKNEVSTRKEQKDALKQLNEISPTWFGHLNRENATVGELNKAYEKYSLNLGNIAKLQAINNEVSTLYQAQVQTQLALQDATAKATQEQLKYNSAAASAREGTKNELPLVLAKNTVDAEKEKLATINAQISKYKDLAKAIPNVTREPNVVSGNSGKAAETEGDKIQKVLTDLERKLQAIQVAFKGGILPDDFGAQVDAIQGALSQIGNINPNSQAFQDLLNDYKDFADQNPVNITVIPTLQAASVGSLGDLPDRVSDVADKMNASFSKINFAQSFEEKARAAKDAIQKQLEGISNTISTVASQVSSALSVINTIESNGIAAREQELDAYYEKQKELIESSINDESIKNKKYEALEKDVAAKRKAIKKDEAAANKRSSIFNAIINTAQGVSAALATGNIPLAAIVGALGAAQVAAITATPLPALAKGGVATGRNTVIVGEYPGADNNPELILPADKAKKYIVEAVASTGGNGGVQQLYSYVSGDDLALISERGAYRKSRVG